MAFKIYLPSVVLSKLLYIGILAAVLDIKFITLGKSRRVRKGEGEAEEEVEGRGKGKGGGREYE